MTLDRLPIGKEAVIKSIAGKGTFRLRLLDMGFTPGAVLKITRIAPFGDPVEIMIRGYRLGISRGDAAKIEVEDIE